MDKIFVTASGLLQDSFRLAAKIYRSGFRPDFIVGIWRGGTPVGIAIQEYFEFRGLKTDHIAVRTSHYTGIDQRSEAIRVHGLHYLIEEANASHSLLIVDDVFDSGRSLEALLQRAVEEDAPEHAARRQDRDAVVQARPRTARRSCRTTTCTRRISGSCFPHELAGLAYEEIERGKAELQADTLAVPPAVTRCGRRPCRRAATPIGVRGSRPERSQPEGGRRISAWTCAVPGRSNAWDD